MKLAKFGILCTALLGLSLVACNGGGNSEPEDDGTATVFVLSGQSNMEGSTTYVSASGDQWLRNAFTKLNEDYDLDLDISYFEDEDGNVTKNAPGVPEVMTSFFRRCSGVSRRRTGCGISGASRAAWANSCRMEASRASSPTSSRSPPS